MLKSECCSGLLIVYFNLSFGHAQLTKHLSTEQSRAQPKRETNRCEKDDRGDNLENSRRPYAALIYLAC
jgi:hypothetical protein